MPESTPGETAIDSVTIAFEAVPHVGAILYGIASAFLEKRKTEPLSVFLLALAKDLQIVSEGINTEFVHSQQFRDLAVDIFSKAAETGQPEVLDALRAIFLNTVLSDRPSYAEAEEISNRVSGWQPGEIALLRLLRDPVAAGSGAATSLGQLLGELLPEWDQDQIDRAWQDLVDQGLLLPADTKVMQTGQGLRLLEGRLTDYGSKVAGYLKNPVDD